MGGTIVKTLKESIRIKRAMQDLTYVRRIEEIAGVMVKALRKNKKLLIAGNGGSAADAQHFAAELVNRYRIERKPLPAIALTTDSSILTSIANDRGSEQLFSRQVRALGGKGDVFVGITTSGKSPNILHAMKTAREKRLITVGLLGNAGGAVKTYCDYALIVPSNSTPRIQEAHITVIHIFCEFIDEAFYLP